MPFDPVGCQVMKSHVNHHKHSSELHLHLLVVAPKRGSRRLKNLVQMRVEPASKAFRSEAHLAMEIDPNELESDPEGGPTIGEDEAPLTPGIEEDGGVWTPDLPSPPDIGESEPPSTPYIGESEAQWTPGIEETGADLTPGLEEDQGQRQQDDSTPPPTPSDLQMRLLTLMSDQSSYLAQAKVMISLPSQSTPPKSKRKPRSTVDTKGK